MSNQSVAALSITDADLVDFYEREAAINRAWLKDWPINNATPQHGVFGELKEPWNIYRANAIYNRTLALANCEYAINVIRFRPNPIAKESDSP